MVPPVRSALGEKKGASRPCAARIRSLQSRTAPAPPGTDDLVFPGDPVNEEADGYLKEMRSKLEDIDALLEEETAQ